MDKETRKKLNKGKKLANNALYELGREYHQGIPFDLVESIMRRAEFEVDLDGIYVGREGKETYPISFNEEDTGLVLLLSWYKMEVTGNYEITSYVS